MAKKWSAVFDPDEVKDYARDWTSEMNAISDTIDTVDFTVIDSASGLQVDSTEIDITEKIAVVWFSASDKIALTNLANSTIEIDHTITTVGGRTYNETLGLKIKIK
jgi:hypothetical protein